MDNNNFTLLNMNKNISLIPLIHYSLPYKLVGTISLSVILTLVIYLVLMTSTTLMVQEFYQPYNHWRLGNFACQIKYASALSICAFSVERWVGICYPMRAHYMCTIKRAIKIITGIWIFTLTYNIPWIFMSTTVKQYSEYGSFETCTFKFKRTAYKAIYMCDLIVFYVLPLLITSVMYCQISWRLFRTDNKGISLVGQHINFNQIISSSKTERSYATISETQHNLKLRKVINRVRARRQLMKQVPNVYGFYDHNSNIISFIIHIS
ncbi:thyrotropin-releasing hormone receptor [Schistosoma bovis]|uniref:Thyrotropin-releasing hormone receptor n=1 Tax=Schistosoma bovis TaxID=6184 RepID=A0A430QG48_SCHBO|nr:thyrotropin-releasing hormone receptor [Schistosoma bovis]